MKKESTNSDIFKRRIHLGEFNFVESIAIPFVDWIHLVRAYIFCIFPPLANNPRCFPRGWITWRLNENVYLLGRIDRETRRSLLSPVSPRDSIIIMYQRARTRRARNSIFRQNWIHAGYRLSSQEPDVWWGRCWRWC